MSNARTEASKALQDHGRSIDDLHRRLAAMPGTDHERLSHAVKKYKAAHQAFEDDALECVAH